MEYTKGEWEVRDIPSHGLEIYAKVNIGKDENGGVVQPIYDVDIKPNLSIDNDGKVWMMIAYESWRQFPSTNFQEMQKANANLIAAAPDMYQALKECLVLIEDLMPGVANIALQNYRRLNEAPVTGNRAIAKAEGK